ncbi:MAG: VWA domain-containing protein [Gammaproteobacteria bacterium]|nr:VWA domain-containing protein [Gammaproteobacteria bacterium]MDH5653246.1 VWA domain-containing protein [Gammaproteobacteria bacterium]
MPKQKQTKTSFSSRLLVCLALLLSHGPVQAKEPVTEVRVVIDVSGSMKKNDPKNLRIPALNLLVGLMPENARGGVWTFAQYANMQVPFAVSNKAWKNMARSKAKLIHSRGLRTNIEEALKRSTSDWKKPDFKTRRNIILLTDGVVDVSRDPGANAQSRERILKNILPRLKTAGVKVHTIALSKSTDEELLRTISMATDGGFVQVDTADELERMFLRLFEKSTKVDTVPILENKFKVDKGIRDFTVLIFRAPGSTKPAAIISPSGKRYTNKQHPKSIVWHHEGSYDLVTVSNPEAGEWKLDTMVDPDNRVMVVTNLSLKVDNMPNNMMLGDEFVIRVRMLQSGRTMNDQKLLALTRFTVHRKLGNSSLPVIDLLDNGQGKDSFAKDGVYSASVGHFTKPGVYELTIRAIGETFNREVKHTLEVRGSPARIDVTEANGGGFKAKITIDPSMLRAETVSIQLKLPDEKTMILPQISETEWEVVIPQEFAEKEITATLVGTRYNGKELRQNMTQKLGLGKGREMHVKLPDEVMQNSATGPEEKADEHAGHGDTPDKKAEHAEAGERPKAEDDHAPLDWLNVGVVFAAVNVIGVVLLLLVIRRIRKRRAKKADELTEEVDTEL